MSALLLFLTCLVPSTARAEAPPSAPMSGAADAALAAEVQTVVAGVQSKYADVEVIRADFVQLSKSALYGDEEQKGNLVLQRPRKMRWQFAVGKQFVTDGDTMWIYNPQDKQVLRFRDFSATSSTADQLLQSLHKVGELFDIQLLPTAVPGGHRLALTPKEEAARAQVKHVELQLDGDYMLKMLVITDAFDSITELTFNNVKLGGTVEAGTFRFVVPDGVEVIDSGAAG